MKRLNKTEEQILVGALKSIAYNRQLPVFTRTIRGALELNHANNSAVKAAEKNVVKLDTGNWVGGYYVSGTLAKATHRAFARLEKKGFIQRVQLDAGRPTRTTHLWLLPPGEKLAKQLLKQLRGSNNAAGGKKRTQEINENY